MSTRWQQLELSLNAEPILKQARQAEKPKMHQNSANLSSEPAITIQSARLSPNRVLDMALVIRILQHKARLSAGMAMPPTPELAMSTETRAANRR
jgi:hypothetical protein